MAKLSAHGTETARFEKYTDDRCNRYLLSFRSDGAILRKHITRLDATAYQPARWHDYGWKLHAPRITARPLDQARPELFAKGWVEIGQPAQASQAA